ncbi:MAG: N-acetyl-gamma-glutamyl-phosphate reductase [Calditrichaceae bacterium]
MIRVSIVGGAGYTGGELIRILVNHPDCEIVGVQSRSQQGKQISEVHTDLFGECDLIFDAQFTADADVMFLCMGHNESGKFLMENTIPDSVKIIDLSQDFRLESPANRIFIYGLPEINRAEIKQSNNIANPGCFATSIELALLPFAAQNKLSGDIHVSAITGSTGAGQGLSPTSHFSWRNSNISVYKPFKHQHLAEINKTLKISATAWQGNVNFIPFRGNFTRGILATVYLETDLNLDQAKALFKEYYSDHPFTHVTDKNPDLKQVVNTNKCLLYLVKNEKTLLIVSAIDNLVKGASGQAVQNMNLMFGLDEKAGLNLKASAF